MIKYYAIFLVFCFQVTYAQESFDLNKFIWTTNSINVCWEKSANAFPKEKKWVEEAIRESWTKEAGINFSCWCDCQNNSKGIHINIKDIRPTTNGFLGKELDGKINGMTLNFTYKVTKIPIGIRNNYNLEELTFKNILPKDEPQRKIFIKATAVHEFGHALGMTHQNDRHDCTFNDCVFDDDAGINGALWFTPCDEYSVMNYCSNAYVNDGNLTQLDIIAIRTLYPKSSPNPVKNKLSIEFTATPNPLKIKKFKEDLSRSPEQRNPNKYKVLANNITLYITGDPNLINNIDSVTFRPHGSTLPVQKIVGRKELNYVIYRNIWGAFTIRADVKYKDGSKNSFTRYVDVKNSKIIYTTLGDKIISTFERSRNKNDNPN